MVRGHGSVTVRRALILWHILTIDRDIALDLLEYGHIDGVSVTT